MVKYMVYVKMREFMRLNICKTPKKAGGWGGTWQFTFRNKSSEEKVNCQVEELYLIRYVL